MPPEPSAQPPLPASGPTAGAPARVDWADVRARLERAATRSDDADAAATRAKLRRRAEHVARPLIDARDENTDEFAVLVFQLGEQTYAVDATAVREVVQPSHLTPLPGLPATLRGLANVRSRIVPAFDLRPLLHLRPAEALPERETMLVLSSEGNEFGALVDRVSGVRTIRRSSLRSDVIGLQAQYLRGLTEDGLLLLDLGPIVAVLTVDQPTA